MKRIFHVLLCFSLVCITGLAYGGEKGDVTKTTGKPAYDPLIMGELYFNNKDYAQAMKWYQEAANNDNPAAQNKIGELYKEGLGVKQDYLTAANWFVKSAAKRYDPAQLNLGVLYENGLGLAKDYSNAMGLYVQAARQGNAVASYKAGYFLQNGLGADKNIKSAIGWYKKAAEAGNVDSLLALGWICLKGLSDEPNYNAARIWYSRAANSGNAEAQNMLGYLYQNGLGAQQDINEAIKWYKLAAKNGNKDAEAALSSVNNLNSQESFINAATKGDLDAMYNLAVSYDNGTGVKVDHVKALDWYIKVAIKKENAKEVYDLELRQKLFAEDFISLEEIAKGLRQKQTKSPTGAWQLEVYYDALSQPMSKNRDKAEHWKYLLDKIKKWNELYPDSITARIVMAQYYTEYPVIRTDKPNSISDEGNEHESDNRQSTAELILNEALKLSERCPQWYVVMLKIASSQEWEESRLDDLFKESIKFEPTYMGYYAIMVDHLSQIWTDTNTDWIVFANKMEKFFGGHEGLAIFSHISWLALCQSRNASKFMQNNLAAWDKIKQGFVYREQIYGSNIYDLNRFCYMAIFAGDNELSRKLFNRIGDEWSDEAFVTKRNFEFHKANAFK